MMNHKLLTFIFLLGLVAITQAQHQANIWYFGKNKGLDFTNTPVKILEKTPIHARTPVYAISNPEGEVLFYVERSRLYNHKQERVKEYGRFKNHMVRYSNIIPHPKKKQLYYIVEIARYYKELPPDYELGPEDDHIMGGFMPAGMVKPYTTKLNFTLHYSLIEVEANKNIKLLKKHIFLDRLVHETHLGVIKHHNSYWFLHFVENSNKIQAYKVDEEGISEKPITSLLGSHNRFSDADIAALFRYIRPNLQGNKIAFTDQYGLHVADFDGNTGKVSNMIKIDKLRLDYPSQNLEFSPDGTKLYVYEPDFTPESRTHVLYQYDLTLGDEKRINEQRKEIRSAMGRSHNYDLQLAPDGKIYGVNLYKDIAVIQNPNAVGEGCGFEPNFLNLGENAFGGTTLPRITHLLDEKVMQKK